MKFLFQNFISLGHNPDDTEEEKLRKSTLLIMTGPFALVGFAWGLLYFANELMVPGSIPFGYGILTMANIIVLSFSRNYKLFCNLQLFLILILPFTLQISLGGFVQSSAVMYWAIIAPAGAMFFDSVKRAPYWFAAYIFLVCIAYLMNDLLPGYVYWNLSDRFINALFLMNIVGVSSLVFTILYYFVRKITELNADIEMKNLALKEQSEKLKEMDTIKSRFFANISHEFRTPLSTILSSASLLSKYTTTDDQDNRSRHIDKIKLSVKHLNDLLEDFLSLGKLDEGKVASLLHDFNLHELLQDTVEEMKVLAKKDQQIILSQFC